MEWGNALRIVTSPSGRLLISLAALARPKMESFTTLTGQLTDAGQPKI